MNERMMMDLATAQTIEQHIEKKHRLYTRLGDCLDRERQALINVDVDALWAVSSEKDELCVKINQQREAIAKAMAPECHLHPFDLSRLVPRVPADRQPFLRQTVQTLAVLKGEIEGKRRHNMVFINDSIQFLDEMIHLISGVAAGKGNFAYDRRCTLNARESSHLLRQEV